MKQLRLGSVVRFVAPLLLAACAVSPIQKIEDDAEPFFLNLEGDTKADGSIDLLSAAERARLEQALVEAIGAIDARIATLETEIAKLEAQNTAKENDVAALIRSIEARKVEVEAEYNRKRDNALIFCLFGYCDLGAVSLIAAMDDDARLQELNRNLATARQQQTDIQAGIARYNTERAGLRAKIAALRPTHDHLIAILNGTEHATAPTGLEDYPRFVAESTRYNTLVALQANGTEHVRLLTQIRDAALSLSDALDAVLPTLRAFEEAAQRAVEASRRASFELIRMLLSGDPHAAAARWLENRIASETKKMLSSAGFLVGDFVAYLMGDVTDAELERRIIESIREEQRETLIFNATLFDETAIPDNSERGVSETAAFDGTDTVSEVSVDVRVEHTFRGDLQIVVSHDGRESIVFNQTGGSRDDITEAFRVADFAGAEMGGDWTVTVRDLAAEDTGKVVSIDLHVVGGGH